MSKDVCNKCGWKCHEKIIEQNDGVCNFCIVKKW
jgi:hypothetical protein